MLNNMMKSRLLLLCWLLMSSVGFQPSSCSLVKFSHNLNISRRKERLCLSMESEICLIGLSAVVTVDAIGEAYFKKPLLSPHTKKFVTAALMLDVMSRLDSPFLDYKVSVGMTMCYLSDFKTSAVSMLFKALGYKDNNDVADRALAYSGAGGGGGGGGEAAARSAPAGPGRATRATRTTRATRQTAQD